MLSVISEVVWLTCGLTIRFEKKVSLRKFDKYVCEVQVYAHHLQEKEETV
jgi:hypothetical protein